MRPGTVSDEEQLARSVMTRHWVREDGTIRPDAFMPPRVSISRVTRHRDLSLPDLWSRGQRVSELLGKPLHGRAYLSAREVRRALLDVVAFPVKDNPEHSHIVKRPVDKPAQKSRAQQLAAVASFETPPTALG